MIQLEVAVAAPVDQVYSYAIPDNLLQECKGNDLDSVIGRRVLVPFGRRIVTGYVLAWAKRKTAEFTLKEIKDILDDSPLFPPSMIALFNWVSLYYHYPIGEVIRSALPAGLVVRTQRQLHLTDKGSVYDFDGCLQGKEAPPWLEKLLTKGALTAHETKKILARPRDKTLVKKCVDAGSITCVTTLSRDQVSQKNETCYRLTQLYADYLSKPENIEADFDRFRSNFSRICQRVIAKAEIKTVLLIVSLGDDRQCFEVPRKEIIARYAYAATILPRLIESNIVEPVLRRVYRTPFGDLLPRYEKPSLVTKEQRHVIDEIDHSLKEKKYKTFLLYGVTGSGKTEVYLNAAELAIEMGRSVLILVPEIALAIQIEAYFVSRFGDAVALLHSGLSTGQRFDQWSRAVAGDAQIVIGARSAVFAPLENLGLIIVDEEHDSSFKQEESLRYHGRDVAIVRARQQNAVIILGSATPAITSFYQATRKKFKLLKMKSRVGGRSLPTVEIVDLKNKEKNNSLFQKKLLVALQENLANKKQSILLLNRRGFSNSMICKDCGTIIECRHCQVSLNLHKSRRRLLCHYCGFTLSEKTICETCGSINLLPVGFGTERVEEEVRLLLPEARVARLDSDKASDRKVFMKILQAVRAQEIDILVGTQMIAKGLHFPNVTLVGVVWADGGLSFPDYRSAEKTFQLISQVTGRAGRGDTHGNVIVQTMQPQHYSISLAANHRYEELARKELEIRGHAGFPPFVRLVSMRVEGLSEEGTRRRALEIGSEARLWVKLRGYKSDIAILGPAPAPIEKLRNMYRWQVLLKAEQLGPLHDLADHCLRLFKNKGAEKVILDVDPENML